MKLNVCDLLNQENSRREIDYLLDLSGMEAYGGHPFFSPVHITGELINRAGITTLHIDAAFSLHLACDRCADEFDREFIIPIDYVLVQTLANGEDEDGYLLVDGDEIDLDELCTTEILLALPTKLLCKEDCAGICPDCGKNLNREACTCDKRYENPQFEALKKLIE
jgi:uncharacterized protein